MENELNKHQNVDVAVVIKASFIDWERAVGQLSISLNHNGGSGYNNVRESTLLMFDEVASLIENEIGL